MRKTTQENFDKAANKLFNPIQKAFNEEIAKMFRTKKNYSSYKEYEKEEEDPSLDNEKNWYSSGQEKFDSVIYQDKHLKAEKKNVVISKVCNDGKTEAEFDQENFDKGAEDLKKKSWEYIDFSYDMHLNTDFVYVDINRKDDIYFNKVTFEYNTPLEVDYSFLKDGEIYILHRAIIAVDKLDERRGFFVCDQMEGNNKVVGAALVKNGKIEIHRSSLEKAGFPVTRKTIQVTPVVDYYTKAFFLY